MTTILGRPPAEKVNILFAPSSFLDTPSRLTTTFLWAQVLKILVKSENSVADNFGFYVVSINVSLWANPLSVTLISLVLACKIE